MSRDSKRMLWQSPGGSEAASLNETSYRAASLHSENMHAPRAKYGAANA